jgi:hypothetical protein
MPSRADFRRMESCRAVCTMTVTQQATLRDPVWRCLAPTPTPRTPAQRGLARGLWTNLGRLPLRVFSIGKYAFQKNAGSTEPFDGTERSHLTRHLEFKCFETVVSRR